MPNPQLEIITIEHKFNGAGTEGSPSQSHSAPSTVSKTKKKKKNGNDRSVAVGLKARLDCQQRNCASTLVDIEPGAVAQCDNCTSIEQQLDNSLPLEGTLEHQADTAKMNLPAAANSNPSTILSSSAISSSSQTNLVRKHSCGDLVSRLKSRKLLGVGENSEHRGEVYRSKISQLLGHSEHLFTRFPLAFWHWYACLIILNVLSGLWNLSGHLFLRRQAGAQQESDNLRDKAEQVNDLLAISTFFRQFCGILYLVFATLLWRFYRINDKGLVRYILLICSVFSIAKIILMLYYDHCNVIALKDWLVSFICSSQCSQDLSLAGAASVPSCSRFSGTSSPPIIASFELTTYIVCDSIEVLGNLWYRRKMGHNASGSNSLLATAAMGSRRVSAHQAASTCEYASFFFSTYLLGPVARLFRLSSDDQHSSTTPNISAPASPTTPNPNGIPEESEDAEMANASVCEKDAEQNVEGEHHHQQ